LNSTSEISNLSVEENFQVRQHFFSNPAEIWLRPKFWQKPDFSRIWKNGRISAGILYSPKNIKQISIAPYGRSFRGDGVVGQLCNNMLAYDQVERNTRTL